MMSHGGGGGGGATVMMLAPSPAGAASLPARATPGTLHCQLDGGEADPFAAAAAAAAAADGNDDAAPAGRSCSRRETPSGTVTSCVPPRGRRGGRIGAEIRARRTSPDRASSPPSFSKTAASSCTPRRAGARCRRWCFPVARRSCTRRVDSLWPSPAIVRSWCGSWGRRVVRRRPCGCPSLRSSPDARAARAAHGGRAPRQVRLARRAVRGWARVRFPSGSEMLGARGGSFLPAIGVHHEASSAGGGGGRRRRRTSRAPGGGRARRRRHGTVRVVERRCPRTAPRDRPTPRVPPSPRRR